MNVRFGIVCSPGGAYGEQVNGPHKPTLDEMGPHAERGLPTAAPARPAGPDRSGARPIVMG
jgi:hypothetical protein